MIQDTFALQSPSPDEIRKALHRVSVSMPFKAAPRLAAFLRFVVEAVLCGRARSVKAYTVAVEALGRPGSFDPTTDACVRVEAGRLRLALSRYYGDGGATDSVVISLPLGTYVPLFQFRDDTSRGNQASSANGEVTQRSVQLMLNERHLLFAEYHRTMALVCRSSARLTAELEVSKRVLKQARQLIDRSLAPKAAGP